MRQKKVYAFVRKLTRQGEIFKGIFGWTLEACKICTLFYVFTLADWNLDIQFDRSFLLKKKAVFQPWREQGMKWTLWLIRARNWFQLRWNQERPLITLYFRDSGLYLSRPPCFENRYPYPRRRSKISTGEFYRSSVVSVYIERQRIFEPLVPWVCIKKEDGPFCHSPKMWIHS